MLRAAVFHMVCSGNAAFAIIFKYLFIVSHYQRVSLFLAKISEALQLQYLILMLYVKIKFVCDETWWFYGAESCGNLKVV